MIMTKFEKIEAGLIIVFEVILCVLKNEKKFRTLLKDKNRVRNNLKTNKYGNKFINSTISKHDDGKI